MFKFLFYTLKTIETLVINTLPYMKEKDKEMWENSRVVAASPNVA